MDAHSSLAKVQLSFSDLRLLFFPVRSSHKLYMLITCPFCIERFLNEMIWYGYLKNSTYKEKFNGFIVDGELKMWKKDGDFTVLVDKPYKIGTFPENKFEIPFSQLGIQTDDLDRMALVSDEDFWHFVQQETEVIQRIDVEKGFLFTEEYLPEKSILYGIVNEFPDLLHPLKTSVLTDVFKEKDCELQLGKNVTLGKGQIRLGEIGAEGNEYNRI